MVVLGFASPDRAKQNREQKEKYLAAGSLSLPP